MAAEEKRSLWKKQRDNLEGPCFQQEGHLRGALFSAGGQERAYVRMISLSVGGVISFHSTGERLLGYNWDKPSYGGEKNETEFEGKNKKYF